MASRAARAAAAYMALKAAGDLMDHAGQHDTWAADKGKPGLEGVKACATHVAVYVAGQAAALYSTNRALGLRLHPRRAALALAVSGVTHYLIDRQAGHWADPTPRGVVRLTQPMTRGWLQRDPKAAYFLDQSWHHTCIALAAVIAGR